MKFLEFLPERSKKMERVILHSDMNSFYASVEMMLDPSLKGKAVAVCGATEDRHGIVLAKSELAKKAGVKTGMVNWEAKRLCPDLILVHPHYDQYLKYSRLAHQIYYRYTDLVEPFGMDECWLDVSGSGISGSGPEIAEKIRKSMKEELGLTVSVGVSFNKIFAKLGSDMKKPDAVTVIGKDDFKEKVWKLPVSELLYVGRATTKRLEGYGIMTIGDLAALRPEILKCWFGVNGIKLLRYANGTDISKVMQKDFVAPIKSIGHGTTCTADLETPYEVWKVMLELSQDVGHKLRVHNLSARGVQITIRKSDLFFKQYQCDLDAPSQNAGEIAKTGFSIFNEKHIWEGPVRAVTVRAIKLIPTPESIQTDFFDDAVKREKLEKIDLATDEIKRRFGKYSIFPAALMGDLKTPPIKDVEIIMPGLMYS